MASVLYALCGHGRGHLSRALAVAAALRESGHAVRFQTGGEAYETLVELGEPVAHVPALRQVMRRNRVRLLATARANTRAAVRGPVTIDALTETLSGSRPDLVVSDFEPFVPRAARRLGVPVVSLSRQQVLTEARCAVSPRYRFSATATALGTRFLAAPRPVRVVVPTFYSPPVRDPSRTVLVPPVLRPSVMRLRLSRAIRFGERVLVYLNEGDGCEPLLRTLAAVGAPFTVYGAAPERPLGSYPNLTFRTPSLDGFLRDLARCRAVISTAGFTLLSEAIHLGKPVLALPNHGFFEQVLNAQHLQRSGRGDAVFGRLPRPAEIEAFLARFPQPFPPKTEAETGNAAVVRVLEEVVMTAQPLRVAA
ncbi:MAG: glycosyltransferase family protein [Rubricoccaceae bacterium]|nr:glycosyltransferase family protein [Rubricoccaceae bacterium]